MTRAEPPNCLIMVYWLNIVLSSRRKFLSTMNKIDGIEGFEHLQSHYQMKMGTTCIN